MSKKVGRIALSAALVGSLTTAAFTGANYVIGADKKEDSVYAEDLIKLSKSSADNNEEMSIADIAESSMPAIVAITNKSVQEVQNFFSLYGRSGYMEQEVESCGSGIIVGKNDDELLIVTNNHVVEGADTLSVSFIDDEVYEAAVKGTDADHDLAVIAVKLSDISDDTMSKIKVIQVGSSEDMRVGEQVVAIGNALGYGQSVTTGIVSAKDRKLDEDDGSDGYIQTDAAINPGNSGGALLNMKGELIGINSAKLAADEIEGMGYAIPVSTASPIMEDLMNRTTREKVEDEDKASAIGISGVNVDSSAAKVYGMPTGVYVAEVKEDGAAENAGISAGYIITKFDGTSVSTIEELRSLLQYYEAGETVDVTVKVADNGEYVEKVLSVTLDKAEKSEEKEAPSERSEYNENYDESYDDEAMEEFQELMPFWR